MRSDTTDAKGSNPVTKKCDSNASLKAGGAHFLKKVNPNERSHEATNAAGCIEDAKCEAPYASWVHLGCIDERNDEGSIASQSGEKEEGDIYVGNIRPSKVGSLGDRRAVLPQKRSKHSARRN